MFPYKRYCSRLSDESSICHRADCMYLCDFCGLPNPFIATSNRSLLDHKPATRGQLASLMRCVLWRIVLLLTRQLAFMHLATFRRRDAMALLQTARDVLLRVLRNKLVILAALIGASYLFSIHTASALPASPGKVPNGSVFSCNTCHLPDPAPKSANTQMKLDFLNNVPTKTWTLELANKDSDGDGFSNGEELQDPNGTWAIGQTDPCCFYYVSNPSDPNSIPSPPQIFDITTSPSPAEGQISFDVSFDAALPIASIAYTLYDPNNQVVYQSVDTAWPWSSGVWNSAGAPKGDYTINVQVNEQTRNPFAARGVATSRTFSLNAITLNGSATAGSDYTAKNGTITFNPGQTSKTINVPIANDNVGESAETFSFTLSNPHGAPLATPSSATITIVDDDQPNIQFKSANFNLPENGGPAVVTVLLSNAASQPISVVYTTSDGTAVAGADYTTASGTLTFKPGETSTTFNVPLIDDNLDEPDEIINLTLSSPTNATLGAQATSIRTILDDDPQPSVQLASASLSVSEGAGSTTIAINLSAASGRTVMVTYATSDGTAGAGSDYTTASGTLTFAPGQTSKSVNISIADDSLAEQDETLHIALSGPTNASLGATASAMLTISDNDVARPTVSISASDGGAAEVGLDTGTFTLTRSGSTATALVVHYSSGGSASAGADYNGLSGSVTIPAGQASATIVVTPVDDLLVEGAETVLATLSADPAYSIGAGASAMVVIADNDQQAAPLHFAYLPMIIR